MTNQIKKPIPKMKPSISII